MVGQAFRAAERGEWPRVWRLLGQVADPLPAKTLRWLRMIEERPAGRLRDHGRLPDGQPGLAGARAAPDHRRGARSRDPADHALIRRVLRRPGAAHHARPDPLRRGAVRGRRRRPGDRADPPGLGRGRLLGARGQAVLRASTAAICASRTTSPGSTACSGTSAARSASRMLERVPEGYRRLAEARMRLQRRQRRRRPARSRRCRRRCATIPACRSTVCAGGASSACYDGVDGDAARSAGASSAGPTAGGSSASCEIRRVAAPARLRPRLPAGRRHGQTEGEDFAEAEWLAGWLALRYADRPGEAFRRFNRMYEAVAAPLSGRAPPIGSAAAPPRSATGRSPATGTRRAARHRIAYYGQLAAIELGAAAAAGRSAAPTPGAARGVREQARSCGSRAC